MYRSPVNFDKKLHCTQYADLKGYFIDKPIAMMVFHSLMIKNFLK